MASAMEAISSSVRAMIAAPPGKKLVVADLANIEGRVLAWLAGEEWKLQAFRDYDAGTGPDLYKLAYSRAFDAPLDKVTKDDRQVGKVMELALGFQGGHGAFSTMAAAYGVVLSDAAVSACVSGWREAHPNVRKLWYGAEKAAIKAIENEGTSYEVRGLRFRCGAFNAYRWLTMRLPSGRALAYYNPQITDDGKVTYTGQIIGGTWGLNYTYGGKFVENAVQGLARDVLMHGAQTTAQAGTGYDIVLTVHDEIVCETPVRPEFNVQTLCGYLTTPPPWSKGLPLAAAGYEAYAYRKD